MKRDDLKGLELPDEAIDKIMAWNGKDIEAAKGDNSTLTTELETTKAQLAEANAQIESFKEMDVDGIKAAADEWQAKAEKAQEDAAAEIASLKFNTALDSALNGAKAKNPKAVKALLNMDDMKLAETGEIVGLTEQLEGIKSENDYLFIADKEPPKIVGGGNNQKLTGDSFLAAARRGAGFATE